MRDLTIENIITSGGIGFDWTIDLRKNELSSIYLVDDQLNIPYFIIVYEQIAYKKNDSHMDCSEIRYSYYVVSQDEKITGNLRENHCASFISISTLPAITVRLIFFHKKDGSISKYIINFAGVTNIRYTSLKDGKKDKPHVPFASSTIGNFSC